jgi:hypothetical protein
VSALEGAVLEDTWPDIGTFDASQGVASRSNG